MLVASGKVLYVVDAFGIATEIAGLPGDGPVQMARNANADIDVAMVADGRLFYYKAGVLTEYDNDFLPSLVGVVFIRGRFVVGCADGRFYYSEISKTVIDALNFYNAEGKPDGLAAIWQRRNEIWLLGTETVELWSPTEDDEDPFSPLGGGALPIGCLAGGTVAETSDDILWVDHSRQVRRAKGMQPSEVSPPWVVRLIEAEPNKASLVGHAYSLGGTNFYELSGSTFTIRYNMDRNEWYERRTQDMTRWRGQGAILFDGKILIGDAVNGSIWRLDNTHPADGDDDIIIQLQSAVVHLHPVPLTIYSLHLDVVPKRFADDGRDRKCMLEISSDGGGSWSRPIVASLGKQGQFKRALWRRLGTYERTGAVLRFSASARDVASVMDGMINGNQGSA